MKKHWAALAAAAFAASGAGLAAAASPAPAGSARYLAVDARKMATTAQVRDWLLLKDSWGPAYTGGPGWQKFQAWIDRQIGAIPGVANRVRFQFPMTLWSTSEFPDKSGWSLESDGTPVNVAAYATQSGSTGPGGVTAPMVLYDLGLPVDQRPPLSALAGKILVLKQQPYSTILHRVPLGLKPPAAAPGTSGAPAYCANPPFCHALPQDESEGGNPETTRSLPGAAKGQADYEYITDADTLPALGQVIPVTIDTSDRNRDQLSQALGPVLNNLIIPSGAVGVVEVMDLSPGAAAGMRQHGTPPQFNVPGLILDRVAGEKVLADAAQGKTAHLVLDARQTEHAPAYEHWFELPGRNYGTPRDQSLLMVTHMDGPSIVEDDGAIGVLEVAAYYARIPQAQRPKTLKFFLDTRHFVAGQEKAYPFDYLSDTPEAGRTIVGGVMMEHLGGLGYVENGNRYESSGLAARNFIWGWPNPLAVQAVVQAVNDQHLPRAQVVAPAELGVHGKPQQEWRGSGFAQLLTAYGGWAGWHVSGDWPSAGSQAFYPQRLTRVDPALFQKQVAVSIQLMNRLMWGDSMALNPDWGFLKQSLAALKPEAWQSADAAAAGQASLAADYARVMAQVAAGDYRGAESALSALQAHAGTLLVPASAAAVTAWTERCATRARTALDWKAQGLL